MAKKSDYRLELSGLYLDNAMMEGNYDTLDRLWKQKLLDLLPWEKVCSYAIASGHVDLFHYIFETVPISHIREHGRTFLDQINQRWQETGSNEYVFFKEKLLEKLNPSSVIENSNASLATTRGIGY
jgi:hypothetical protein